MLRVLRFWSEECGLFEGVLMEERDPNSGNLQAEYVFSGIRICRWIFAGASTSVILGKTTLLSVQGSLDPQRNILSPLKLTSFSTVGSLAPLTFRYQILRIPPLVFPGTL